jgi:uncharacterized protein YkwD
MRDKKTILVASLLLACGCAAALEANRRVPGTQANGVFTPGRPAAASYGADPARTCPAFGVNGVIVPEVEQAARSAGKPVPQPDGRLCAMAETLLGWEQADPPPLALLNYLSWYFGLPSPARRVVISSVESEDSRALATSLSAPIADFGATAAEPRYGLSTQRVRKNSSKVALVLLDATAEVDPLPRKLAPGTKAAFSGRLGGALEKAKVQISDVAGHLETPPQPGGKAFGGELRCGDRPGLIVVEVRAEEAGAEALVANFPVACGQELPASAPLPSGKPETPAEIEKALFEVLSAERSAAGLKPLVLDEAVTGVARALSEAQREAMKRGGSVSSDAVQRLKAADIMSPLVLQNSAQARNAADAAGRFQMSPPNRANYMSADVTHAGIGVAATTDVAGKPAAVVTELFVKQLPPLDPPALREKLYEALARKRSDARAPALKKDPPLEEMAQKYAAELAAARGDLPKARDRELIAPLYKSFLTVNILGGAKNDPLEFAEESGALSPGKLIGVGVAQGTHPVLGKNAVYVVVFIAARR